MNVSTVSRNYVLPFIILISLLFVTLVCWWGYKKPLTGIDDANIYFVYMKHFAQGHGFVWNIGGERVEGFTSLLWTLLGALFYKLSAGNFPILLLISGFSLSFFTIYTILRFSRKLNGTEEKIITYTDIIILSLLIAPRGFVEWNIITLMESSLWTFLLVTTTLELCSHYLLGRKINVARFCLLLILLNLTRPESIAFNFLFLLIFFIQFYIEVGLKYGLRRLVIPMLAHIGSLAILLFWRISYFGYPFPNTYYAKVSGNKKDNIIAGLHYLFNFFYVYPHAAFLIAILFFFSIFLALKQKIKKVEKSISNNEKILMIIAVVVFSGLALPILTGGDHFMLNRFYQPFLPLLYLAATNAYVWQQYFGITIQLKKMANNTLLISLVFAVFFLAKSTIFDFYTNLGSVNFPEFEIARNGRIAAVQLNETFAAGKQYPTLGTFATGAIGYMYIGNTIDMLGLNSTVMAHANNIKTGIRNHASFDKKAFWQLKPDVLGTAFGAEIITDTSSFVLYENMQGFRNDNFMYLSYKKIYDDDDFRAAYIPALVQNQNLNFFVFGYYYKPFLEALDKSIYKIKILERNFNPHP